MARRYNWARSGGIVFSAANIGYWLFGTCHAASVGALGFSWERMRKRLNRVLPSGQKVNFYPPFPRSFGQLICKTNELAHFLKVLDQYRNYYPSSSLPKILGIALISYILSFIGIIATGMMT